MARTIYRPGPVHKIPDHAGKLYTVVGGCPLHLSEDTTETTHTAIHKLSIQLYCLEAPKPTPAEFGWDFLHRSDISGVGNMRNYWPRVDVHVGFPDIAACIAHAQRERAHRQRAAQDLRQRAIAGLDTWDAQVVLREQIRGLEPLPHIVTWRREWHDSRDSVMAPDQYRSMIIVVPAGSGGAWADVRQNGLHMIKFDLDLNPGMTTFLEYEGDGWDGGVECELAGEDHWAVVESNGIATEPVQNKFLCAREPPPGISNNVAEMTIEAYGMESAVARKEALQRMEEVRDGWKTPGNQGTLKDAWDGCLTAFLDCTYRRPWCEDCTTGEPHERCAVALDEHYFNDEGRCVGCWDASRYRRRSRRLAEKIASEETTMPSQRRA
jgi:hypothetical protein